MLSVCLCDRTVVWVCTCVYAHYYTHTYMHTTCIHTHMHTYIHTYVHTYIHTYIHTGNHHRRAWTSVPSSAFCECCCANFVRDVCFDQVTSNPDIRAWQRYQQTHSLPTCIIHTCICWCTHVWFSKDFVTNFLKLIISNKKISLLFTTKHDHDIIAKINHHYHMSAQRLGRGTFVTRKQYNEIFAIYLD